MSETTKRCQVKMHDGNPCGRELFDDECCIFHSEKEDKNPKLFQESFDAIFKAVPPKCYDFTNFVFPKDVLFPKEFPRKVIFLKSAFNGKVRFDEARFGGGADFGGVTFCTNADFWRTTFQGEVSFLSTRFLGEVSFDDATFKGEVEFIDSVFSEKAYFRGAGFGGITHFGAATFQSDADFQEASFGAEVHFLYAKFRGNATFVRANFKERVELVAATLGGLAWFTDTTFEGDADFTRIVCNGQARFWRAVFHKNADFSGAKFRETIEFWSSKFKGAVYLSDAMFEEDANFGRACFEDILVINTEQKDKKGFRRAVDFRWVKFANPEEIHFQKVDLSTFRFLETDVRRVHFTDVDWYKEKNKGRNKVFDEVSPDPKTKKFDYALIAQLYRRMRANYEENLRYSEAGDFYIGEMEMTRKAERNIFKKLPLLFYKAISNYGESYYRPLCWIAAILLIFALIFMFAGIEPVSLDRDNQTADIINYRLDFSSFESFLPSIQKIKDYRTSALYTASIFFLVRDKKYTTMTSWGRFLFVLESILSPVTLAFFLLALRRRFKR